MVHSNPKSEVTLEISALSYGPHGIGRHEGRVVMVPGTVCGDRISARIIESRSNYDIGSLSRVITASAERREPPCPYVGACGGCPWQQIDYDAQLAAKVRNLDDALRRIGKLGDCQIRPIVRAPREFNYRRRIQMRCGADKQIGFSAAASHDLVAIEACAVAAAAINRVLEPVRRCIGGASTNIAEVEIIAGDHENEIVVVAGAAGPFIASDTFKFNELISAHPVKGVVVKAGGGRQVWGDPRITVATEPGTEILVDADVFTQINPEGNRALLQHLLSAGEFSIQDRILELYCGAGNFTLPMARRSAEVVAVESE